MSTHKGHQRGRSAIEAWADGHPENMYLADPHLQRVLAWHAPEARWEALDADLTRFGAEVSAIDPLVRLNNEHAHLPELTRYSPHGRRVEQITHHPSYHEIGRVIYGSNVMAAYQDHPNNLGALARFYVSSFNGEAGHNCPLACTAGVIRVLQELGTPELKARYLGRFLDADYANHYEGAQFLTEVQGGSDVGQNATRAWQADDGTWRIDGEKWFCSNIDADVFLMTARLPETAHGTRGLGLFLVPRLLDDGEVNRFFIRRLKDKLGTRSMASGECDFEGAVAHHMGEVGAGFKHMMELVINTSRLYNAVGGCAMIRRVWLDAARYARHRVAFGAPIAEYPLVQETLADLRVEADTFTSGTFALVAIQDRIDGGEATAQERGFMRLAVNLNKLILAKRGRASVIDGIEIFGGNGAIETFSVLPRLLRDAIVYENWEGTHNTLLMQALRDMHKYRVHEPFLAQLEAWVDGGVSGVEGEVQATIADVRGQLERALAASPAHASLLMRPLADTMSQLLHAAARARELSAWIADGSLSDEDLAVERASLHHFVHARMLGQRDHADAAYLERLKTLL